LANASGGLINLGVEDDACQAPAGQHVPADLPDQLRKRIGQLTVNVGIDVQRRRSASGGEYVEIRVFPNQQGVASTTKGGPHYRPYRGTTVAPIPPLTGSEPKANRHSNS